MKNLRTYRCGGMTLVEIMVAVAITVGMLLLVGMVFKSATDASGSALALNDVNGQARVLTEHLQSDFAGFQKDLPFAIIFEGHVNSNPPDPTFNINDPVTWRGDPDEPDPFNPFNTPRMIRYDRICFFASGDFQPPAMSYPLSGNLARIFYGQMLNSPYLRIDNDVSAPRQILSRRQKIMTASPSQNMFPAGANWSANPIDYDYQPFEFTPISTNPLNLTPASPMTFWKNVPTPYYLNAYFNDLAKESFIRRPNYDWISANPVVLQPLQLLSDVTDFKIQLYLYDITQQRWRWRPDDQDMIRAFSSFSGPVAFYWNTPDLDPASDNPVFINNVAWFCDKDKVLAPFLNLVDLWPKAIRFTFTLYDANRRRFPEGQTFSYIVKIPPRY